WKAFGGNTYDLDSTWDKTDKITTLHEDRRRIGLHIIETLLQFLVTTSMLSRDDVRIYIDDIKVTDSEKPEEDSTG
nr:hypothetical protein [Tanacetum cinerariifolium]